MKILLYVLLASTVWLVSCSDKEDPTPSKGTAGNESGDGEEGKLAFEQDTLYVPTEGGTFTVKVQGATSFTFTNPNEPVPPLTPETFPIFNIGEVSYTASSQDNQVTLTIEPATGYVMEPTEVSIYSMDGKDSASLVIVQERDETQSFFGLQGKTFITMICSQQAQATYYMHTMEALYTRTAHTEAGDNPFETHTITPWNSFLSKPWDAAYVGLSYLRMINRRAKEWDGLKFLSPHFTFLTASTYYQLAVLWENVPFTENLPEEGITTFIPAMKSRELFTYFEKELSAHIDDFENKKNAFDKEEDYVNYSKDFPRMVLAKMYLYQKEYDKAEALLKAIVADGHYRLAASRSEAMQRNSSEMIWGYTNPLLYDPSSIYEAPLRLDDFLPFATYTEVILSLAECEYHAGNSSQALSYLKEVTDKRGLSVNLSNMLVALKEVWASELKGTGTYFAFLKRNDLAQRELDLETYRLIFPIPQHEVNFNDGINQNPGYE